MTYQQTRTNMVRRPAMWVAVAAAFWAVSLGLSQPASAQGVDELLREADRFDDRVDRLEQQYLKPAILAERYKLETRFNDARVQYLLENYDRASLLLVDVVRDASPREFDSYRRALYLLGDSLYQQRNFLAAQNYLRQVIDMGPGEYYQDAVVGLLEIAVETGNYKEVDGLFERVEQAELSAAVSYMRAKTLYRQDKYDEARRYLADAARDQAFAHKAAYLRGVTQAAEGNYAQARETYRRLIDRIDQGNIDADSRSIKHLSHLALGRIAYETGDLETAIDAYQKLPRDSEHFDQALYELTWVLVTQGEYRSASRNADIFLYLSNPDKTFIPEIRLLKADLMLRLDEYEDAKSSYRDVSQTFEPVQKSMVRFIDRGETVREYFKKLVDQEFEGQDPTYLPEDVREYVDEDEEMKDVKLTVEDINRLEEEIETTRAAIQEIEARLGSGSRVRSFPRIAEGISVGIEVESQLVELREDLLQEEYRLLKPVMSQAERDTWRRLEKEMQDVRERYEEVPHTRQEVEAREEFLGKEFGEMRAELDRLSRQIDGQRQQLKDINQYVRENLEGGMSQKRRQRIEELRADVRNNISQLEEREKALRQELAVSRQKMGVGDAVTDKERELRQRYRNLLADRQAFLKQFQDRVSTGKQDTLRRIEQAWNQLPKVDERLQSFFAEMNRIASEKAADLRETIARERRMLERREERLANLRSSARGTIAGMAMRNYAEVKNQFDEIVLRGDVGLIDVAWREKEGMTDKIDQLRENRRSELEALRDSFEEVR
jgi:tetratricopeptide (TPR) repeat protein